mmetsp:Transcript_87053/g.244132  ORF Transcript_87053/g.244132 Transcript_87053/m.244132 type:complete len:381 (+) Transcript_87053:33-1175(+)
MPGEMLREGGPRSVLGAFPDAETSFANVRPDMLQPPIRSMRSLDNDVSWEIIEADLGSVRAATSMRPNTSPQTSVSLEGCVADGDCHRAHDVLHVNTLMELMGWSAEPFLLRRLVWYIAEAFLEAAALASGIVCFLYDDMPVMFVRFFVVPLVLVLLRLFWALRLAWAHDSLVMEKNLAGAIKRIGHVHSKWCWIYSGVLFVALSSLQMVWYVIMILVMTSYEPTPSERGSVAYMISIAVPCALANGGLWSDYSHNSQDSDLEDSPETSQLQAVMRLYRKKEIRVLPYSELHATGKARGADPGNCTICLEQFIGDKDIVQLPCGHIFHPVCAHRWICEDLRCPFRCALGFPPSSIGVVVAATRQSGGVAADVENGLDPQI